MVAACALCPGSFAARLCHHSDSCQCHHPDVRLLYWRPAVRLGATNSQRDWDVQRAGVQLLPLLQDVRALRQHRGRVAVRGGELRRRCRKSAERDLPLRAARLDLPAGGEPERRTSADSCRVPQVAPENVDWCEPENDCADRAVRPDQADQLGTKPLGLPSGAGVLGKVGENSAGRLRRGLVLHDQCKLLRPQRVISRDKQPVGEPDWYLRRSPELRLEDAHLGIAGRQSLVRRNHQLERQGVSVNPATRLAHWFHGIAQAGQAPEYQTQLQRWYLHSCWRELPERLSRVAVVVDWQTKIITSALEPLRVSFCHPESSERSAFLFVLLSEVAAASESKLRRARGVRAERRNPERASASRRSHERPLYLHEPPTTTPDARH